MTNKETLTNLVSSLVDMAEEDNDDEDTDNDMLHVTSAFMVQACWDPSKELPNDTIQVRANLQYSMHPTKTYAITDGGADSCILGKFAKVISHTGKFATLVGYDPNTTRTDKVPIVSALIKARSSTPGQIPVLLKVNEAVFNSESPIILLSEYQIRENSLVIDSVAKKHKSSYGKTGTQCFHLNQWLHIDFEDRGGLMGFEILPIKDGDVGKYKVIMITNPN